MSMPNYLPDPVPGNCRWLALLAVVALLHGAPLAAAEAHRGAVAAAIPVLSGGVGDEERAAMRGQAAAYNVHVVFSQRSGAYLAGIPYTVTGRDGTVIHSGSSDGPLLYLRLPAGQYRIGAMIDGVWQSRRIRAESGGRPAKAAFVAAGE
jgi:hypothetical protein